MKLPSILEPGVQISYDFEELRNVILVLGAKPAKGQKRTQYTAVAPRRSEFNPHAMARNGEPRRLVEVIETNIKPAETRVKKTGTRKKGDDKPFKKERVAIHSSLVKRRKHAREIAERHLGKRLRAFRTVECDVLPQFHLELGDVVVFKTEHGRFETDLDRYSLPLAGNGTMALGSNKKIRLVKRRRHKKGKD